MVIHNCTRKLSVDLENCDLSVNNAKETFFFKWKHSHIALATNIPYLAEFIGPK